MMMGFNECSCFDHKVFPLLGGAELKTEGCEAGKNWSQILARLTHATEQPGRER